MIGEEPSVIAAMFAAVIGFFSVMAFMGLRSREERSFLIPLGLAAYALKAALVPAYYSALMATGWDGFAFFDSVAYHDHGAELAREFERGIDYSSTAWTATDPGFPFLTAAVYWLIGPNTLVIRMMNCAFSVFSLLYVYRIARVVFEEDPRVARIACYLTAFLPFSIAIAINHRKEPLVVFLVTYLIYHGIRIVRTEPNWTRDIGWVVWGVFLISFFRSGFVFPYLGTLLVCFFFAQRSIVNAVAMSILAVLLFAAVQFAISDDSTTSVLASTERLRGKLTVSADRAEEGGLVALVRISSPLDLYKLPVATALAAILPYPPYFRGSFPSILLSWLNLANLVFLPSTIWGAWIVLRRQDWRRCIPIVLFPLFFLVVHGLVNVGISRYRETTFPIMLILAGAGLARGGGRLVYGATYLFLIALGSLTYIVRY